jgi:hypothetical protein
VRTLMNYLGLVWTPCIMHRCVISTMFGWCFWFFKKTFLFKQPLVPPPRRPGPSHFPLRFFTPSSPPRPVLHISHSGSLTRRSPPPGPQNPLPPSSLQRWARGNTKPPSQALSQTNRPSELIYKIVDIVL